MHDEGVKFLNRLYPFDISTSYLRDSLKLYLSLLNVNLYEYYMNNTNLYTIRSYIRQVRNERLIIQTIKDFAEKNDLDIDDILRSSAEILVPLNDSERHELVTTPGTSAECSEAFSLEILAVLYPLYIVVYLKDGTDLLIRYENHVYFVFGGNQPTNVDIIGVF